jgi:hypothetical protein
MEVTILTTIDGAPDMRAEEIASPNKCTLRRPCEWLMLFLFLPEIFFIKAPTLIFLASDHPILLKFSEEVYLGLGTLQ